MCLLTKDLLYKFFYNNNYVVVHPDNINNNKDTLFVTAGIQPLIKKYKSGELSSNKKFFIAQPVIRTQFCNSLSEGTSLAFINATSSSFNNSEKEYYSMIDDWYENFYNLGMKQSDFSTRSDSYDRIWGDLTVRGKRTFHYYENLEIGDTTFFTYIANKNGEPLADTMCDLGFGIERIRWKINKKSYYDLHSDSSRLPYQVKAYLSAIALLAVNDIKPSNKSVGYRARLFSKKLVLLLNGRMLNNIEENYLNECIRYWNDWQCVQTFNNRQSIIDEYVRNSNRYIIDILTNCGYNNISGIDINISRGEFAKRLVNSGVNNAIVKKLTR